MKALRNIYSLSFSTGTDNDHRHYHWGFVKKISPTEFSICAPIGRNTSSGENVLLYFWDKSDSFDTCVEKLAAKCGKGFKFEDCVPLD